MTGAWGSLQKKPTGKWDVWKFNWLARHKVVRALERAREHVHGTLLDIGCGSKPFAALFDGRVERYLGADLPMAPDLAGTAPDVYARAELLPFRSGSFDAVLGIAMLNYLPEPRRMIEEARRVLRPGGVLVLEFPQTASLHPYLYDYFRFTRFGAEALLEEAGFVPVMVLPIGGAWSRMGLSAIAPLNRINRGPVRILTELPVRLLYVVIQLVCEGFDRLFPTPAEPLSHVVVARKPARGETAPAPRVRPALRPSRERGR